MNQHLNHQQLISYVYRSLVDPELEAAEYHLNTCSECRARLAEQEAIQRQVRAGVLTLQRQVSPPARMSYAAIAPNVKRRRNLVVFKQSAQFVYGALTMLLLVAIGVGLYFFVSSLSRPTPTTPEEDRPPTSVPTVESQPEVKATAEVSQPEVNATAEISQPTSEVVPVGELKWQVEGDYQWSRPVVADGLVYVGNAGKNFYALDSQTGQVRWEFQTNGPLHGATPVVAGGVVYFGGRDRYLYALDSQTGQEKWKFNTMSDDPLPTVQDGLVYVGANDLHVLDSQTGQELWQFKTLGRTRNAPLVVDGMVFIASGVGGSETSIGSEENEGYIYAIDAQTGQEKWQTKVAGLMRYPVPMASVEDLVIAGNYEYLYALKHDTGQVQWQLEVAAPLPIVAGGSIYVSSSDGHLYALEPQLGQELWKFKTGGPTVTDPVFATGVVYVGSTDHYFYAVDAHTGREVWKFETGGNSTSPAISDGVLYFGSSDNFLYALR